MIYIPSKVTARKQKTKILSFFQVQGAQLCQKITRFGPLNLTYVLL